MYSTCEQDDVIVCVEVVSGEIGEGTNVTVILSAQDYSAIGI